MNPGLNFASSKFVQVLLATIQRRRHFESHKMTSRDWELTAAVGANYIYIRYKSALGV